MEGDGRQVYESKVFVQLFYRAFTIERYIGTWIAKRHWLLLAHDEFSYQDFLSLCMGAVE